jgi:hypothetical protein
MQSQNIKLKIVSKSDDEFLYNLLKERNPNNNISHIQMPTYKKHQKFMESKPYSKWYVIYLNDEKIGSIYLSKKNEIGIHTLKNYEKNAIHSKSLKLLIKKNPKTKYFANISTKNLKLQIFFKKHGFKLLQQTYALINKEVK